MTTPKRKSMKALLRAATLSALAILAPAAQASFLDTDFWCQTYGCVVVYDTQSYTIYDNFQFNLNLCCVAYGSPMSPYQQNFQTLRQTGTTDAVNTIETADGLLLGISADGTDVTQSIIDNGNGYLDASDELTAFTLTNLTDVKLDGPGKTYSHSFWISSRNTYFSLRAHAFMGKTTGDFTDTINLQDISLVANVQNGGNDNGFEYGSRASNSNITFNRDISTLGDLSTGPTPVMHFGRRNGIRIRNGDFDDQVVRVDFEYSMPEYDMSMGVGEVEVNVKFDFYRELNKKP